MLNRTILLIFLIIISFTSYISYNVYSTFVGQYILKFDNDNYKRISSIEDFDNYFTNYPPITVTSIPIPGLRASFYLQNPKTFSLGKSLTEQASIINPYTGFSEYILGKFFYATGQTDSALYYSKLAFDKWPKSINNFKLYNQVLAFQGDTLGVVEAYKSIEDVFRDRISYGDLFIKYYAYAKVKYMVKTYANTRPLTKNELFGKWQSMHEFETGEIRWDNTFFEFSDTNLLINNKNYYYKLDKDSLYISPLSNPEHIMSKFNITYSDSLSTLIIKYSLKSKRVDDFFKKID